MNPEEIYQKYLRDPQRTTKEELRKMLLTGALQPHFQNKVSLLKSVFDFAWPKNVLDVGSTGFLTHFLTSARTTAIDGDKETIEFLRPCLKAELIYNNFYEGFPQVGHFDLALHIDFPEHLPDKLYTDVYKWTLEHADVLYVYTPLWPLAADQEEHVSVKTLEYFQELFKGQKGKVLTYRHRMYAVVLSQY